MTSALPTAVVHGKVWVDRNAGIRLHYRLLGNGPATIVLLHGAPQTSHAWRHVLPLLADAGYRVIAPDVRGAGASAKPRGGYDKWTMAADIHGLLHDHLGVTGPVSVVGHDLGAMLAVAYALRYRDDVVSLATMEAPIPGTDYYEQRKVAKSAWHFDLHANVDIALGLTSGRERWYVNRFYDDLAYLPDAITAADREHYGHAFEAPGAMRALFEHYAALDEDAAIHRNALRRDGKLAMPVWAGGGGAQTLTANYPDMMREIAEDVTAALIPDCGHWIPEERPPQLAESLIAFDRAARARTTHPLPTRKEQP
jgi:pimeloyl-ACP methyl ester carboxylesterase